MKLNHLLIVILLVVIMLFNGSNIAQAQYAPPTPTPTPVLKAAPIPTLKPTPVTTPAVAAVTIELQRGWNLIGVPREIDISQDNVKPILKKSDGYKAWYYWPADDKYYGSNYLYPGWGYWVESETAQKWEIPGQEKDVVVELTKGWNLISVPSETPIEEFEKQVKIKSADSYKAWYYWPADGKYYGSNRLYPGWGYWVETAEKGTIKIPILAPLQEKPNPATFNTYFSDLGLGKLPAGGQLPQDVQLNVTVFNYGDQICLYGTIKRDVFIATTIYDSLNQTIITKGGFPRPLPRGGFAGTEGIKLPAGKYEYRVYVEDTFVAVFPFEVL